LLLEHELLLCPLLREKRSHSIVCSGLLHHQLFLRPLLSKERRHARCCCLLRHQLFLCSLLCEERGYARVCNRERQVRPNRIWSAVRTRSSGAKPRVCKQTTEMWRKKAGLLIHSEVWSLNTRVTSYGVHAQALRHRGVLGRGSVNS
jgi:hypothetical protein